MNKTRKLYIDSESICVTDDQCGIRTAFVKRARLERTSFHVWMFHDFAEIVVIEFAAMLDRKIKAAQTMGLIYFKTVTGRRGPTSDVWQ